MHSLWYVYLVVYDAKRTPIFKSSKCTAYIACIVFYGKCKAMHKSIGRLLLELKKVLAINAASHIIILLSFVF